MASKREIPQREEVERIVRDAPLDEGFAADVDGVAGDTIDEL